MTLRILLVYPHIVLPNDLLSGVVRLVSEVVLESLWLVLLGDLNIHAQTHAESTSVNHILLQGRISHENITLSKLHRKLWTCWGDFDLAVEEVSSTYHYLVRFRLTGIQMGEDAFKTGHVRELMGPSSFLKSACWTLSLSSS